MFAMLSLAAICARLGLPCLAVADVGCCNVGKLLRFVCEPSTRPLLARLLPATAAALADVTLTCLRPAPAIVSLEGLDVEEGMVRVLVCGVEPDTVRELAAVCC